MHRYAANISLLFGELPYLDRFRAAAEAGFEALEILYPYDVPAKETRRALLSNGLDLVLINAPPPNYAGGTPGYAALPDQETRFQSDMRRVLRYADMLRPAFIHLMAGYTQGAAALDCFVRNLQWAADHAPAQAFTIEPLNPISNPGYFLNDYAQAAEILQLVDRPNVGLQFDSFHADMIHGAPVAVWDAYSELVCHVQIGAAPDRTEPGQGRLNFSALRAAMAQTGYDGWISAEYKPTTALTQSSLQWMS